MVNDSSSMPRSINNNVHEYDRHRLNSTGLESLAKRVFIGHYNAADDVHSLSWDCFNII